ncbi:hypothetical protein A4X13_0g2958 [Tilletia indica]|uniref:Uncharacterized protein n=1 Tax=Tilletia indica TaxID=43049 RepID=A0A177TPU9_9BASI|nr:hypothetical protein A4X13_0g2958 [Tilletia indica]
MPPRSRNQRASHALPFELHRLIIHASDIPTLAVLARVCKAFYDEANPLLYAHISINEDESKTPTLSKLLHRKDLLRHIETFHCAKSSILQGQASRKYGIQLWDTLLTHCPKLQVASWIWLADTSRVKLVGEMVRFIDRPEACPDCCPPQQRRRFEWHLYGDVDEGTIARLTRADMDLVSASITVTPGRTQLSVDKIEQAIPALWEVAPDLSKIQINVGYNLVEIGSRLRRMDRARAFQALTTRLQEQASSLPDRNLRIAMSPSSHIFPTSIDAVDRQLASMVQADFDKLVLKSRSLPSPRPSTPGPPKAATQSDPQDLNRLSATVNL